MRTICGILCTAILLGTSQLAWAGPLAIEGQPTLRMKIAQADLVVFGRTGKARKIGLDGETELIIHDVIKAHPVIKDRKVLKFDRFIESDPKKPRYFVVTAAVVKGRLHSLSGFETDERGVAYIHGFLKLDPKKQPELLRNYYFDFIGSENQAIADDAYLEWYRAPVAARFEAARTLPAAKVWKLLRDTDDPSRSNFFASLLASCGKPGDADELFKLSESSKSHYGFYFSILSLNGKEYSERIRTLAKDKNTKFLPRYYVFRAVRDLHEANSTGFPREKCEEMMADFLEQGDMADFAIESFAKWKRWEHTEAILKLHGRESHKAPIVRRWILRYALQAPGEQAAAFVAKMRREDPESVRYVEEQIEEEKENPAK